MDIYPHQICGDRIPFREAGKIVQKLIQDNWRKGEVFIIHFEGKTVDSISFFDEAIALLLTKEITIDDLKRRVRFPDIQESDKYLLNFALAKRIAKPNRSHFKVPSAK